MAFKSGDRVRVVYGNLTGTVRARGEYDRADEIIVDVDSKCQCSEFSSVSCHPDQLSHI